METVEVGSEDKDTEERPQRFCARDAMATGPMTMSPSRAEKTRDKEAFVGWFGKKYGGKGEVRDGYIWRL